MKKIIAACLLMTMVLSFAVGCSKPQDEPTGMNFENDTTPTPALAATPSPDAATPQLPSESPDPEASVSPDVDTLPTIEPVDVPDPGLSKETPKPGAPKNYKEAKKINKDVIGWIKVPGTNIDYPILFDKGNDFKYNYHDIYGEKSSPASIYSYWNNQTRNFIISGHNSRTSGTMFHELHKVQNNKSNLTSSSNRTFSISLPGIYDETKWEVFALYETKDKEPSSTRKYNTDHLSKDGGTDFEAIQKWIDTQKEKSEVKLDVNPKTTDFFITLVTCGDNYDNSTAESRLYVFLRSVS